MKKLFTLVFMAVMAISVKAQTYILDVNKMYDDAVNKTGMLSNASLSAGSKYLLNDATYIQDIFTVVSKSNRTYRIDLYNPDATDETYDYGDYVAKTRLEPNGASNSTGGRQMFVEVTEKGALYIGAWTGTTGRKLVVCPANDKTSYINVANITNPILSEALIEGSETKTKVYEMNLEPGLYCITQDASIYFAYVKFVVGAVASGINGVTVNGVENSDAPVYNLSGQRVSNGAKGLLIQNGKKYIAK
ncbi:MAG: hypothetical protein ACI4V5_07975 [Prevotella sp.]